MKNIGEFNPCQPMEMTKLDNYFRKRKRNTTIRLVEIQEQFETRTAPTWAIPGLFKSSHHKIKMELSRESVFRSP